MKRQILFSILFLCLKGQSQVVPDVSPDSLMLRMFPIYRDAFDSGVFNLPRDTSWRNLTTYNLKSIEFKLPKNWLQLGGLGNIVEVSFDASGLYFPEQFNGQPVLVGIFLLNQRGRTLEEISDSALKDYRNNSDRVFESEYKDSVYSYALPNNVQAHVLHTRFLRKSNQLNQSRYDLVFFSEAERKGYSVMVSVQYSDRSFKFERDNFLENFAARIFSNVSLK